MAKTVMYKNHRIEISTGLLSNEKIFYDGKEVSSKSSVTGSTHIFRATEDGEDAQYEVIIGSRWHGGSYWAEVRRNGMIIFTDR